MFPSSLLDSLVKNLDITCLSQGFGNNVLDLAKQKGFDPYENMSNFEKFKEQLPSKEKVFGLWTGKKLSGKKYEHVLKVWNKFEMKKMKDYYDLHLKCDLSLLADVFEKFRNNCLKNYGLCSGHYLSAPALSWDAILNMTKVKLELVQILTCTYFLKMVWEVEFLIFLIDIVRTIISIWNLITQTGIKIYYILRLK